MGVFNNDFESSCFVRFVISWKDVREWLMCFEWSRYGSKKI
jgi:hypothetical protein